MIKPRTAFDSTAASAKTSAILKRQLRQALLRGTILAGAGVTAAIAVGGQAFAQSSSAYPSCVNSRFCSHLPAGNWLWTGDENSGSGLYDDGWDGAWQTIDPSGNIHPAIGYPGFPNDPNAVIIFQNGLVNNASVQMDFQFQAYSWTIAAEAYFEGSSPAASVEFPDGGGIFSSAPFASIEDVQIKGYGGVYLFPADGDSTGSNLNIRGLNNTYKGPTEIDGGTLTVLGGGAIGDRSAVTIRNLQFQGLLTVGQSETIGSLAGEGYVNLLYGDLTTGGNDRSTSYSGSIIGAGALIKTGAGTFTLAGLNTYTGGTQVAAGTLVGNAVSIPGAIANVATVVFDQATDASFGGAVTGLNGVSGQMVKQGAGVLTLTGTSVLPWHVQAGGLVSASDRFTGDLQLAAGTSFTFDQTYAGTYAGEITGAGDVTFSGGGIVTLTGESTAHSGTSTVSGTLSVNGTHGGSVAVAAGGTLKGNGTTGNTTVAAGGTIAPGNSIGVLTVNSDLTYSEGSTYEVQIEDGRADRITVLGTATLNGADVAVELNPAISYRNGQSYDILHASAVVGRFAPVELASAFLRPDLAYSGTDVTLSLSPLAAAGAPLFATVAESANQRQSAKGLDGLDQTAASEALALYNAILFSDAATARSAFDALSGEVHASVTSGLVEDSRYVRDAMADRMSGRSGPFETGASTSGPSEGTARLGTSGIEAWTSAYGSRGETAGDGNAASLDRDAGGVLVGLDGLVSDTARLGLLAGYGSTSLDLAAWGSSASIDSYHLGVYGGGALGRIDLKAGSAYSWNEIDTARFVSLPGFSDSLDTSYDAGAFQLFGEASTRVDLGQIRIDPFANLAYVSIDTNGFREKGGAAALASSGTTDGATFSTLGLRSETALATGTLGLTMKTLFGWRHAYGDTTPDAALRFAGGDAFAIEGAPIDEDAAVVEIGLAFAIAPKASLGLHYAGQFGENATDNGVSARLGIEF